MEGFGAIRTGEVDGGGCTETGCTGLRAFFRLSHVAQARKARWVQSHCRGGKKIMSSLGVHETGAKFGTRYPRAEARKCVACSRLFWCRGSCCTMCRLTPVVSCERAAWHCYIFVIHGIAYELSVWCVGPRRRGPRIGNMVRTGLVSVAHDDILLRVLPLAVEMSWSLVMYRNVWCMEVSAEPWIRAVPIRISQSWPA